LRILKNFLLISYLFSSANYKLIKMFAVVG
jgi:hypothetical protein